MNSKFNPLESQLLFSKPARLLLASTWVEHTPFAMLLVELHKPRAIVELGTLRGVSYCAFCQAVEAIGLETHCYAVDTWEGDDHAGYYGDEVYNELKEYHKRYEAFSKLLRMRFDEALDHIPDHSVDLLHIDGLHSYEAVKHDYSSWLPKMSRRGIVLFHDTMVTDRGFGVHKFWAEISRDSPHFNFEHGYGLGVLAVGAEQPEAVKEFLDTARAQPFATRRMFSALGQQLQWEIEKVAEGSRTRLRRVLDLLK